MLSTPQEGRGRPAGHRGCAAQGVRRSRRGESAPSLAMKRSMVWWSCAVALRWLLWMPGRWRGGPRWWLLWMPGRWRGGRHGSRAREGKKERRKEGNGIKKGSGDNIPNLYKIYKVYYLVSFRSRRSTMARSCCTVSAV